VRAGDRFPSDILRPVRYSTLVFLGWSLYASFRYPGIDYAQHIGGLAAGFLLGLTATPTFEGEKLQTRRRISDLLSTVSFAAVLLLGGFWWAQRGGASLTGDGLYYRTVHWIRKREHSINTAFNSALRSDHKPHAAPSFELDIPCVEEKSSLCKNEKGATKADHGVPVAVTPNGARNLGAVSMCTQEVVTRVYVAVQSITAEIQAPPNKDEEVDHSHH
jgi:hypothetical protein